MMVKCPDGKEGYASTGQTEKASWIPEGPQVLVSPLEFQHETRKKHFRRLIN